MLAAFVLAETKKRRQIDRAFCDVVICAEIVLVPYLKLYGQPQSDSQRDVHQTAQTFMFG